MLCAYRAMAGFSRQLCTQPSSAKTFPQMLRHSPLMQMGDISNRLVRGQVVLETEQDLYIDFGGKFNAVCKRPRHNADAYAVGSRVIVKVKDLELSSRFLGSDTDLTLLEADAVLVGLEKQPTDPDRLDSSGGQEDPDQEDREQLKQLHDSPASS